MSFFWGDGFDLYALPADASVGSSYWELGTRTDFTLAAGRFAGSRGFASTGGNNYAQYSYNKTSGQNDAVHHFNFAVQTSVVSSSTNIYWILYDGATAQVTLQVFALGEIRLYSGAGSSLLATYSGALIAPNTWYSFECEIVIHPTAGSFKVRKNGNTSDDFAATSLNTRPGTNSYANKISMGSSSGVGATVTVDDLLWRSDTSTVPWVGDIRCYTRRPASDAAVQWSRAGASSLQQTIGGSATAVTATNTKIVFSSYTIQYSGSIASITFVTGASMSGNLKAAIWDDNAGAPGAVLATAGPITATPAGNNVFTLSTPLVVTPGQKIWIGSMGDTTAGNWTSLTASSGGGTAVGTYATFPQANPVLTAGVLMTSAITYSAAVANYQMVSEPQQDAATSYVYSANVNDTDQYTLTGTTPTPTTVVGVTTRGLFQKSDAGTRNAVVQLKSGATTVESASTALSSSGWGWIYRTDLTDPASGVAWTPGGVSTAQVGARVAA